MSHAVQEPEQKISHLMTWRVALNTHRVRSAAVVAHAERHGIAIFDVLGLDDRGTQAVLEAQPAGRIIARVGYSEGSHSLRGDFVEAETRRLVDAFGCIDVLAHHPEVADPTEALARLRSLRQAGLIREFGVATNAPVALDTAQLKDVGATIVRAPTTALDDAEAVAALENLRDFEVVGHRPLLKINGEERRLVDQEYGDVSELQRKYVAACDAVFSRFDDDEQREACDWIRQLVDDLNKDLPKFTSVDMWQRAITSQIVPMLHSKFEELDEDSGDVLQEFFQTYGQIVRWHATDSTRALCPGLKNDEALADWALRTLFLRPSPPLAAISIAMDSPEVIDKVLAVR